MSFYKLEKGSSRKEVIKTRRVLPAPEKLFAKVVLIRRLGT
jgi:hypothetical protein